MIVKMTTAETDQTTWKDVGYNISTGQYQSSSGFIEGNHEFTVYICSKTMSGSYIYDVVWHGLEMIENKQKKFLCSYKLQFTTFINA